MEPQKHTESTSKKRILIVEDTEDQLVLIQAILKTQNYDVTAASSGKEALISLSEMVQPNLILLDIQLGDMSGYEFLMELEKSQPTILNNVPVVFLTGMENVTEGRAVGIIKKPFDLDKFFASVNRFIENGPKRSGTEIKS